MILFAALYAVGVLRHDRNPILTYGFGAAALAVSTLVLVLPARLIRKVPALASARGGRIAGAVRFIRESLGEGIRDAMLLLRQRSPGVLAGSVGTMAFDLHRRRPGL